MQTDEVQITCLFKTRVCIILYTKFKICFNQKSITPESQKDFIGLTEFPQTI